MPRARLEGRKMLMHRQTEPPFESLRVAANGIELHAVATGPADGPPSKVGVELAKVL